MVVVPPKREEGEVVREVGDLEGRRAQLSGERGLPRRAATTMVAMRRRVSRMAVKRRGSWSSW